MLCIIAQVGAAIGLNPVPLTVNAFENIMLFLGYPSRKQMSGGLIRETVPGTALFVYTSSQIEYLAKSRRGELSMKAVPHLGFLYLAAVLRDYGIDCVVMDRTTDQFEIADLAKFVHDRQPVFVGFYSDSVTREAVCAWVSGLRAVCGDLPILVGGPNASEPGPYLAAGATMVCTGEGERAIVGMVEAIEGARDPSTVDGIAFMKDGVAVVTAPAEPVKDLDELPFPRRDIIDMHRHHDWRVLNMRQPYTTMITSRGCHRGCTFCSVPHIAGHGVRLRSPQNVLAEIDELVLEHGVRYITFKDDYFAADHAWEEAFLDGLIARKHDLIWTCQTHPFVFEKDREARMNRYRRAGCDLIIFGLQSSDPNVLRLARRSVREPSAVRANVQAARRAGIQTVVEFIFGLPGCTRETIAADIDFALKIRPQYAAFYPLMRLAPSELFDQYGETGDICGIPEDELMSLSSGAYRRFYLNPRILLPTGLYVLTHNPFWLRHGFSYLRGEILSARR